MPRKELATFTIEHLSVLAPDGGVDESLVPELPEAEHLRLYRAMVTARMSDERMLKLQRQGRIGTFAPASGQEAPPCAAALRMKPTDWFVGCFRELGGYLMRGVPLWRNLLFHAGFEEGNVTPEAERTMPISIIVGAQTLHAVGLAFAARQRGETDTAAVVFCGDGATSEGDFHEALNFASVWQVPVVFVVQNNQWAISLPREKQCHARTLAQRAIAYDMAGLQVDGNDPLAMVAAMDEALHRARSGEGPTLVEAVTYRMSMHTTADDPRKYRDEGVTETWRERDPILRFRRYLEGRELWNDDAETGLRDEIARWIDEEVARFEAHEHGAPDVAFDHVFGTAHPLIEEQRQDFLATLGREGLHG